jgi:phenylpropionate dioxygenase-like ring-hydroxylating dioxygenase large terminal subunit
MATAAPNRTLPWSWYSDPAVLELEQESIFGRSWQYAAHSGQVAEPGSYVATRAGHLPVVVVRDREGALRAFVNVCRHRGSLVCDGSGRRETLQCPYHAWTYGLDGSLLAAPRSDREPGFDAASLGLLPVRADSWGPFVFVNPDLDAAPLAEHLGELPALLAADGLDVDALVFHARAETEYEANWKVCSENYLECYHCSVAHPTFSQAIDVAPDAYTLETRRGGLLSQFGPPRNGGGGVYDASGEIARGQFHFLFPNTAVNVMPGRPNLSVGPIVPLSADRTYRYLDYFFAPGTDAAWIDDYMELDNQVGAEDRLLVERVHTGMRGGVIDQGALLPVSERLIAEFQNLVASALAR